MSAEGFAREFEGCSLDAYPDAAGIWTIGYGHTGKDVWAGLTWTQAQCEDALTHDLAIAELLLRMYSTDECMNFPVGAQDALSDFVFNLGIGHYRTSTLRTAANAGDWPMVKAELLKWDHCGQAVIPGLLRRREAEANSIEL